MREPQEVDWEPARRFFEQRRVRRTDLGGAGEWRQWSEELEDENDVVSIPSSPCASYRVSTFILWLYGLITAR